MEKKLAEYRAKKERQKLIEKYESKLRNLLTRYNITKDKKDEEAITEIQNSLLLPQAESDESTLNEPASDFEDDTETGSCCTVVDLLYYFLWFVFWAILYLVFIKLEFGIVYLVVSALVLMYLNTRTTPKKVNEVSAYSVFNKNCKSIDGSMKAEQFEREIVYGFGSLL